LYVVEKVLVENDVKSGGHQPRSHDLFQWHNGGRRLNPMFCWPLKSLRAKSLNYHFVCMCTLQIMAFYFLFCLSRSVRLSWVVSAIV